MLANVQALRAFAAFLVVFVHLRALAIVLGQAPGSFEFGECGVDIFFVISGMIMVLTTQRRNVTPSGFMRNRIARIVPFYWLITAVVFTLALMKPDLFRGTRADAPNLLKSLFFIPFLRPDGVVAPVVFVGWTLDFEMAFYLLFAASLALRNRTAGLICSLAVLVLVALGGWVFDPKDAFFGFFSQSIILEFGLGMVIGALLEPASRLRLPKPAVAAFGVAALALMIAGCFLWPKVDRFFAVGLPAAGVVFSTVYLESVGWKLRSRTLLLLGDASFATYLTHFFVTQATVKAVQVLHVTAPAVVVLAILATLVLVAITGVVVHLWIERPLSRAVKALLSSDGRRRPLPPSPETAASAGDLAV